MKKLTRFSILVIAVIMALTAACTYVLQSKKMINRESNAHEIPIFFLEKRLLDNTEFVDAITVADRVKCHHCPVYVYGEGRAVSTHTIVEHWKTRETRRICRRCWGQAVNQAFYTASSAPWREVETVEVKQDWK